MHVESSIWGCHSNVRIVTVEADHIYQGVDKKYALDKHVLRTMWLNEKDKTEMVIAVRMKEHYWWGAVTKGGQQKVIFSIEEATDAVGLVVDALLKRQPPLTFDSLARMSKEKREEAIEEQATKPKKNKKVKKTSKHVSWGGQQSSGSERRGGKKDGWMTVGRRKSGRPKKRIGECDGDRTRAGQRPGGLD